MGQFQPVAGPSQDEFNALSGQVTALNGNLTNLTNAALKAVLTFQVPTNSSKVVTITSEWSYSFLVFGTHSDVTALNGVLFFVNGYVSASRGIAIKLGTSSNVSIDMSSENKQITITNSHPTNPVTLTIVPIVAGQSFSVS